MSDHTSTPRRFSGVRAARPVGGKRKAERRRGSRPTSVLGMLPIQRFAGVAALAVAAVGAVSVPDTLPAAAVDGTPTVQQVGAMTGTSAISSTSLLDEREETVSRDSADDALEGASAKKVIKAAEAQAKERNAALAQFAKRAEQQAKEIALNKWVLPLDGYRLTATFGQSSGLWARTHTGLDFAAPSGTPIRAVTNGVISETGYAGAYGNQTVQTLEDGTEVWYAHQTTISVSPGDTVRTGQVIGTVGSTGNSTGPHLHLEVRPGAGDPVDPFNALSVQGLTP